MNRGDISQFLRRFGLTYSTDLLRYRLQRLKNRNANNTFKKEHPDVKLPPDYLIYESFQINYKKYYTESKQAAHWIVEKIGRHLDLRNKKILDWGCGPGRIIRHLPELISNGCEFFGTDYNDRSIDWCSRNLPGIKFNNNTLEAKLPYPDNFFDAIYGISIFTHLSENMHYNWYKELIRVLKPGGILLITAQGDNFKIKLSKPELENYMQGKIVERGNVKEGHRTYSAFHPKAFMENLFANDEILEHLIEPPKPTYLPQDTWIIKKK